MNTATSKLSVSSESYYTVAFCKIFTSKFHSVYTDCRRLWEIVKDSACTFRKLLKIACPIVKDCVSLVLVLATHSLRLILHDITRPFVTCFKNFTTCSGSYNRKSSPFCKQTRRLLSRKLNARLRIGVPNEQFDRGRGGPM